MRLIPPTGGNTYNITGALPPTYLVYRDGATYYAKTTVAGLSNYSGAAFHTVVNSAITGMTSGHIYIAPGAYTQTGAIAVLSNVTIEADKQATITMANNSNCHMVSGTNKTNFHIVGGVWDGNKANQTAGMDNQPFYFNGGTKASMRDLIVHDGAYANIYFESSNNIGFMNIESYNPTEQCIMGAYCSRLYIADNYCHDAPTKGGIYVYTEDDATVQHADTNIIVNNKVENTYTSGISISLRGAEDFGNYNVIANNICIDCGTDGQHPGINIGFTGASQYNKAQHCVISDNTVYETTGGQCGDGILAQCDHCSITGNVIDNYNDYGIVLAGDHNVLSDNDIRRGGAFAGILLWGGDYNRISGNVIADVTGSRGIYLLTSNFANACSHNHVFANSISGTSLVYNIDIANAAATVNVVEHNQSYNGTFHDVGTGTITNDNYEA